MYIHRVTKRAVMVRKKVWRIK